MVCIVLIFMVIFFLMVRDTGFPFKGVSSVFFFKTKQSLFSSEKSEGLTMLKSGSVVHGPQGVRWGQLGFQTHWLSW